MKIVRLALLSHIFYLAAVLLFAAASPGTSGVKQNAAVLASILSLASLPYLWLGIRTADNELRPGTWVVILILQSCYFFLPPMIDFSAFNSVINFSYGSFATAIETTSYLDFPLGRTLWDSWGFRWTKEISPNFWMHWVLGFSKHYNSYIHQILQLKLLGIFTLWLCICLVLLTNKAAGKSQRLFLFATHPIFLSTLVQHGSLDCLSIILLTVLIWGFVGARPIAALFSYLVLTIPNPLWLPLGIPLLPQIRNFSVIKAIPALLLVLWVGHSVSKFYLETFQVLTVSSFLTLGKPNYSAFEITALGILFSYGLLTFIKRRSTETAQVPQATPFILCSLVLAVIESSNSNCNVFGLLTAALLCHLFLLLDEHSVRRPIVLTVNLGLPAYLIACQLPENLSPYLKYAVLALAIASLAWLPRIPRVANDKI